MAAYWISVFFSLLCCCCSDAVTVAGGHNYSNIPIGSQASFTCPRQSRASPVWKINGTYYNFNRLPDEYSLNLTSNDIVLLIPRVKLWMNHTYFSCYFIDIHKEFHMGVLIAEFDFFGPEDATVSLGQNVLINCNSSIIISNRISVVWKIGKKYYNPTRLPIGHYLDINGLYVRSVSKAIRGIQFQCLFKSNLLQKQGYYRSKTGTITVDNNTSVVVNSLDMKDDGSSVNWLTYRHQGFYFNENDVRLAWNNASDCLQSYSYNLTKTYHNSENTTDIGSSDTITLQRNEISVNSSGDIYAISITATAQASKSICGLSEAYLLVKPEVNTVFKSVLPGGDICFDGKNLSVVWPETSSGEGEDCICDVIEDISECECVNNTIYDVGLINGRICWKNITHNMNKTNIIFFTQRLSQNFYINIDNRVTPLVEREYITFYQIIISGPPTPPSVISSGWNNEKFCLVIKDNYNGHSQIKSYTVMVNDSTSYSSTSVYTKNYHSPTIICFLAKLNNLMSRKCGPQSLTIQSTNDVATSIPSTTTTMECNDTTCDKCSCFSLTVNVNISMVNQTSDTIYLSIQCEASYDNTNMISFEIRTMSTTKIGNCSGVIGFDLLQSNKEYIFSCVWNDCEVGDAWRFSTASSNSFPNWGIGILTVGCSVIIVISLCMIVLLWNSNRKKKLRQPLLTDERRL